MVLSYYKMHFLIRPKEPDEILLKTYELLKRRWDTTLRTDQFEKAYICIDNHSKWEYAQTKKRPIKPMTEVAINQDGYFGIIDYVDLAKLNIIDWKTGKYPNVHYNYKVQAYIYKQLIDNEYNLNLEYFRFYFMHSNTWRTVKYATDEMRKIAEDTDILRDKCKEAMDDGEFEKNPLTKTTCKNCLYRYYCMINF